jgi:hypothetical protein
LTFEPPVAKDKNDVTVEDDDEEDADDADEEEEDENALITDCASLDLASCCSLWM